MRSETEQAEEVVACLGRNLGRQPRRKLEVRDVVDGRVHAVGRAPLFDELVVPRVVRRNEVAPQHDLQFLVRRYRVADKEKRHRQRGRAGAGLPQELAPRGDDASVPRSDFRLGFCHGLSLLLYAIEVSPADLDRRLGAPEGEDRRREQTGSADGRRRFYYTTTIDASHISSPLAIRTVDGRRVLTDALPQAHCSREATTRRIGFVQIICSNI